MSKFFIKHSHWLLIIGIILSFIILSIGSTMRESLTYDEIVHSQEGLNHLQKHTFSVDPYNPPLVRELQMLPVVLGASSELLFASRSVTILLGALLLLVVYLVTRKYFGERIALLAPFFLAFEPNFLAHGHYVTPDVGTALFFFLAYAALVSFWKRATFGLTVAFGVSLGLAMAARVMVIPYFAASMVLLGPILLRKLPNLRSIVAAMLISFMVVWAAYFFRWEVVIAKGGGQERVSEQLKNVAEAQNLAFLESGLTFLENRPLPLGNYLATVKNSFLRSTQNTAKPLWYELPTSIFLKTPIPLLLLTLLALLKKKKGIQQLFLFVIPIIGILGVAVITSMEPRVRYVLPMYPFIAVLAAIGIREVKGIYGKLGVGVLLLWYVVGTLLQFPHFISYTNEFVPRQTRYLYFTDSNIDWGQSLPDLQTYVSQTKPSHLSFSYFGRDNGNDYGLVSNREWGSYKSEEICAFHEVALPYSGERLVAISVSNWYGCGYSKQKEFTKEHVQDIIADSILVFR